MNIGNENIFQILKVEVTFGTDVGKPNLTFPPSNAFPDMANDWIISPGCVTEGCLTEKKVKRQEPFRRFARMAFLWY